MLWCHQSSFGFIFTFYLLAKLFHFPPFKSQRDPVCLVCLHNHHCVLWVLYFLGYHALFMDESGFQVLSMAIRAWRAALALCCCLLMKKFYQVSSGHLGACLYHKDVQHVGSPGIKWDACNTSSPVTDNQKWSLTFLNAPLGAVGSSDKPKLLFGWGHWKRQINEHKKGKHKNDRTVLKLFSKTI
jgi:hypothetical protein